MASPSVDVATGITIVFGTSGFSAQILDVTPPGMSRESLETTHQSTMTQKTFMPADLYDSGELGFDIHFNPDTSPPIGGATETITITFPSGATWAFSGFMTNYYSFICPWKSSPPAHEEITVRVEFVDYLTGKSFTAQKTCKLQLPSNGSS